MWKWSSISRTNKILAAISVALLIAVLGSVFDGCGARKRASAYLDLARGWHDRQQADEAAWKKRDATRDAEIDRLKTALTAARTGKPWRPPAGATATAERFRAAGYGAEVRR
jgi:hypothetical protein